jgi:hypothetical protein
LKAWQKPLKENPRKVVLGENDGSQKARKQKGVIKKGKRQKTGEKVDTSLNSTKLVIR